jgi:WD40 repeat protein
MRLFDLPDPHTTPEALGFSPDGLLLAVWDFGRVFLIDTVTGTGRTLQAEVDWIRYGVPGVGFTPDGQGVIAFHNLRQGRGTGAVRVYDVASGKVRRTIKSEGFDAMEPAADGRFVFLAIKALQQPTEIIPWDPVTGEKQPGFGRLAGFLRQLAVSADGQWVAGSSANEIRVWDLRDGKRPTRAARKVRALNTARSKTGSSIRWPWLGINALALSADGVFVAAGGSGVIVWEVQTGAEHPVADWFGDRRHSLGFHPTRPVLAFPQGIDEVVFWDAATRSERQRFTWEIGFLSALAFSPDGLRCAAGTKGKVVVWDVDL